MGRKITENSVLFLADNKTQVFVTKLDEQGNVLTGGVPRGVKAIKVYRDANGVDHEAKDVHRVQLNALPAVLVYLAGFNALPCQPRSGYDTFYNQEGPTNPKSPLALKPDGKLRNILVFLHGLHMDAAKGGQIAEDANKALALIGEYNAVAAEQVKAELGRQAEVEFAAKAAELGITPEEFKEFLAKRGKKAPVVPVAAVEDDDELEDEMDEATSDEPSEEIEETV
jgi:hypothetical protein